VFEEYKPNKVAVMEQHLRVAAYEHSNVVGERFWQDLSRF